MAQEICKNLFPQASVFSRGLYANTEYAVPAKVLDFLHSLHITPKPHVSTQLTADDLQQADHIFCMEKTHLEKLSDCYAQYSDKMWLLNDFSFSKETDLQDPILLSGRSFIKQATLLKEAVEVAVNKIKQNQGVRI